MRPRIVLISAKHALVVRNEPADSDSQIHSPYASIALKEPQLSIRVVKRV
jgi:hypothetical protein